MPINRITSKEPEFLLGKPTNRQINPAPKPENPNAEEFWEQVKGTAKGIQKNKITGKLRTTDIGNEVALGSSITPITPMPPMPPMPPIPFQENTLEKVKELMELEEFAIYLSGLN